jgi:ubiquinone biosynthesis protein
MPSQPLDALFGQRLARTFIYLGPTFIKLGQVLATRPDIVGDAVATELRVLFDRVPSVPFRQIRKILTKEWGKKWERHFQSVDERPLASASIAQTHSATLKDGTPVIVKIQKEGVSETVRTDLTLLEGIARSLDVIYPHYGIRQIFEDFKAATLREVDYRQEAHNLTRFRKNYSKLFSPAEVVFPKYYPKLSTRRVLVLEPLMGKKVSTLEKGTRTAKKAAAKSLAAILEQIFDHGFFHADPHAGNLFFMEDTGKIGFIDLGLVGHLGDDDKQKFLKVILSVLKRDRDKLAESLFALGTPAKTTDYASFERQIQALLDRVKQQGMSALKLDALVNELLQIARDNAVHIPNRYVLMIRSCLVIEGVAKQLDPDLSVFQIAVPIVTKSLLKTYNPFRRKN